MAWVAVAIGGSAILGAVTRPKTPDAPDLVGASNQDAANNLASARVQAHLNNPNYVTPYGNRNITYEGDQPTITDTLSPEEQRRLDLSNYTQTGMLQAAGDYGLPAVTNALRSSYTLPGQAQTGLVNKFAADGFGRPAMFQVDPSEDGAPTLQSDVNTYQGSLPGSADAIRNKVTAALYGQQTQMLDPQMQQQQAKLTSDLANQGITMGSPAYQTAMDNFERNKQQAYGSARDSAILAGGNAANQQYGQDLSTHQTQVQDALSAGNFHNTARDSVESLRLNQQQVRNQAVAQGFQAANADAAVANSGRAQNYQELVQSKTLPINVLDSILHGGQVDNPQFGAYSGTAQIAPSNIMNATANQAQYNTGMYNAQAGQSGQFLGVAGNLAANYFGRPGATGAGGYAPLSQTPYMLPPPSYG